MPYPINLAEKVGYSVWHIYDLESGRSRPGPVLLAKLAELFDMRPSDLEDTIPTVPPRGSTVRRTEVQTAEVA